MHLRRPHRPPGFPPLLVAGLCGCAASASDRAQAELGDHDRIGSDVRFFEEGPKWPRRQPWMTR